MARTTSIEPLGNDPPAELLAGWERLANELCASPFLYPGWVVPWWRAFRRAPAHLAVVREDGELVAALPLVVRGRVLASPANWHTPETGMLAHDDDAARALLACVLDRQPSRASFAFLDRAAESTAMLREAIAQHGCALYERQLANAPYVELDGTWEAFEAALPARERKELRRRARRLDERGRVWLEVSDGSDRLDARFFEFVRVEGMGWKGQRGTAIRSQPRTLSFYRHVAAWAAERGWLRLQTLRLDDASIAVGYALEAHGVQHSLKIGYDPSFRTYGPGVALMREVVRQAFADRLERIELLGGEDKHKLLWASGSRERIVLQAFSRSLVGRWSQLIFEHGLPLARRLNAERLLPLLRRRDRPRV
jgi:CelD/BcsL family acetyltransferase involved in cellulose biosynthesis